MNTTVILLVLTIITPPGKPDLNQQVREPTLEKCWEDAKAFIDGGIPKDAPKDTVGIGAACGIKKPPEEPT